MKMKKTEPYLRKEDITTKEIGDLDSFRDWDEHRKAALVGVIKTFTEIMFHIYSQRKKSGKVIALSIDNQPNIAA
jgi:hypothetical protein